MSFTDQKPFTVTEDQVGARWGGGGLRCAWCGHRFGAGEVARWIYTNGGSDETKGIAGNPFICERCDGPRPEILRRLRETLAEFEANRFWWFRQRSDEVYEAAREAARDEQRAARDAYDEGYDKGRRDAGDGW